MYNVDNSSPTVTNCTFSGNSSDSGIGGGMYNSWDLNPTVNDTVFCMNSPDQIYGLCTDGGGNVINADYCPPPKPTEPQYGGDVDGDGDVDMRDFALMAGDWLEGR